MSDYIAVDIGASSGRIILGVKKTKGIELNEIHRFNNGFTKENGHDRWNIDYLINEIFIGLEKANHSFGIRNAKLGIDTWAVDYVLVDKDGNKIANPISYRDQRTVNVIEELTTDLSKEYIYQKTGIQFLEFNTLYQLYKEEKNHLKKTDKIMMIPDYIGYVLTGNAVTEVTNASTTQMLNLRENLFDADLLEKVHVQANQFPRLVDAGTPLGFIQPKWTEKYTIPNCEVITVATHDTASAVVGTPGKGKDWAFLSSGTWSLLGKELSTPEIGVEAYKENYTNEWGAYGTYRFLKNIMGLWMIQRIRKELPQEVSFSELAEMAAQVKPFQQFIDVNDSRFINPDNMIEELRLYCKETGQKIPKTTGELVAAVYSNLALFYACELKKLQTITKQPIHVLNIVGGGSNITLLNQLTSTLANIEVMAGPSEATAIGNLAVQMITTGEVKDLAEARGIISESFDMNRYHPESDKYPHVLERYQLFLARMEEVS